MWKTRNRTRLALERLEDRTVPAVANFDFEMLPRIIADANHRFVIPNTPDYADPPQGFAVKLDATPTTGDTTPATDQYEWEVRDGTDTVIRELIGLQPQTNLPEGTYNVTLKVTSGGTISTTSRDIVIDDLLIVAMGDSFFSGEGAPEAPQVLIESSNFDFNYVVLEEERWAQSTDGFMTAEHREAHRSSLAAPAQAALRLEEADKHTSVTFVNVAQSGASIPVGLMFNMEGGETIGYPLPPQIAQLEQMLQGRRIDALLLSVGGNDMGFNSIQKELALNLLPEGGLGNPDNDADLIELGQVLNFRLGVLGQRYNQLDAEIRDRLNVDNIFLTQYFNPVAAADGSSTPALGDIVPGIVVSAKESDWARENLMTPLDALMRSAAEHNDWTYIDGIAEAFFGHGYTASADERFVNKYEDAQEIQGASYGRIGGIFNPSPGTMHPNARGHQVIADQIYPHLEPLTVFAPEAVITGPGTASAGETVTFSGEDSTSRSPIDLFEWDVNAGANTFFKDQTGPTVNRTLPASDYFHYEIVKLRITDGQGLTDIDSHTFGVFPTSKAFLDGRVLTVNGTVGNDNIQVSLNAKTASVTLNGVVTSFSPSLFDSVLVHGFHGNDTITVTGLDPKPVTVNAGLGNDSVTGGGAADDLNGGEGDDTVHGGLGNDTIHGDNGADSITGGDGNDIIQGGDGNDTLRGDSGNDNITGGDGHDSIFGGAGDDVLSGNAGDDFIDPRPGADVIDGGPGSNTIEEDADDTVLDQVTAGDEDPNLIGEKSTSSGLLLRGTDGPDDIRIARRVDADGPHAVITINGRTVEHIYRRGQTIVVLAGAGNDRVILDETAGVTWTAEFHGEAGHDVLVGAGKDDVLIGGPGHDILIGRAGTDRLLGDANDRLFPNDLDGPDAGSLAQLLTGPWSGTWFQEPVATSPLPAPIPQAPLLVRAGKNVALAANGLLRRQGSFLVSGGGGWAVLVDYGDRSGERRLKTRRRRFLLSHRYRRPGTYRVTVTVVNGAGRAADSFLVRVRAALLS